MEHRSPFLPSSLPRLPPRAYLLELVGVKLDGRASIAAVVGVPLLEHVDRLPDVRLTRARLHLWEREEEKGSKMGSQNDAVLPGQMIEITRAPLPTGRRQSSHKAFLNMTML